MSAVQVDEAVSHFSSGLTDRGLEGPGGDPGGRRGPWQLQPHRARRRPAHRQLLRRSAQRLQRRRAEGPARRGARPRQGGPRPRRLARLATPASDDAVLAY